MPFDGLMLSAICWELNQILINSRIEKIYQPAPNDIILHTTRPRERYRLLLSAHPRYARVHLSYQSTVNPVRPPTFCMVLRKHLEGGYINKIEQPGLERILKFHVHTRDELGQPAKKVLVCEVMGKHSNILLVDPAGNTIIDGIRRYSHEVSRHREVLPGRPYISPPAQEKQNPLLTGEESFRNCLFNAPLEEKVCKIIQSKFEGFSTVMAREILYRAMLPENLVLNHCGEHEIRMLWQAMESIIIPASKGLFNPTVIEDDGGNPVEFAAFDLKMFDRYRRRHGDPSKIADDFFNALMLLNRFEGEKQSLTNKLNKEKKRLEKKRMLQTRSANSAAEAENYKIFGELLTANIYRLKKGIEKVQVANFYHPNNELITIPLKPGLSPAENAQAYFKKYVKAKNTRRAAQEQAQKTREELDYLLGVLYSVEQATSLSDLEDIKQELMEQGYLKHREYDHQNKNPKKKQRESPSLLFTSSDGYTILVGRNNKQNDRLTMKMAGDNDIWLHTKEIPGSHVIIKNAESRVPEKTIHEAAVLAAYFSRARNSSKVPVDYTRRKYVKKPRGAKPGYVIYEQQHTVVVNPDKTLVTSLAQKKYPE